MNAANQADGERPTEERVYLAASELLGFKGKKALLKFRLEVHEILREGLTGKTLSNLRRHCQALFLNEAVEPALGMSLRTVRRFEADKEKPLSSDQSSRVWKFAEIVARATPIFGSPRGLSREPCFSLTFRLVQQAPRR
jgi:uncharacterized protein (DUF2384 family)